MALIHIVFGVYITLFLSLIFYLGLNGVRIRERYSMHPRLSTFVFPIMINLMIANTLFRGIPSFLTTLVPCLISLGISIKMEKVRIIGITGSIATGKSTLTKLVRNNFKEIDIIDCDQISRNLRKRGQAGYNLLVSMLGERSEEYLNPLTRQFDQQGRQKLNQYVFNNQNFRKILTKKMGIMIIKSVFIRILKNIVTGQNLMAVDAPLLYQSKILQHVCYPVALVGCSEQIQIQRLKSRDGYSEQQAKKRIASQMPLSEKRKKTRLYLNNEGSEQDLLKQFSAKIKRYLSTQMSKNLYAPKLNEQ